jgi:hypothetical protein
MSFPGPMLGAADDFNAADISSAGKLAGTHIRAPDDLTRAISGAANEIAGACI